MPLTMSSPSSTRSRIISGRGRRIVGAIAVHQDVHVSLDIGKHPPNHVTFALHRLAAHDGALGSRARATVPSTEPLS